MKGLSLPNNISDALPALSELVRRAVDGSVPPLQIDVENQRILIRSTTASAATSLFEAALTTRWTTAGVTTWDSTANFRSAINVTGTINSSGNANYLNVTAGLLNITSTADFRSAINVTGNQDNQGWLRVNLSLGSGTSTAAGEPSQANTLYADNIIKGWISFNGSTATPTIRDWFNVSSLIDSGMGNWTINWATDFANANYSAVVMSGEKNISWGIPLHAQNGYSSSQFGFYTNNPSDVAVDNAFVTVMAVGDQ